MRLPPLNSLRAFEVAARRGGFVGAAEELNVTPAAVSHQVKTLESYLEVALFRRLPRGLELTEAGRELLPQLSRGFDHVARAVGSLSRGTLGGKLTINVAPSLAVLWLAPRLGSFIKAFPEIRVRLLALATPPDLALGEADLRIPYGSGVYPGLRAEFLMRESIFPVCSPSLLNRVPLRRLSDLRRHTLLHDVDVGEGEPTMTWRRWLRDAGLDRDVSGEGIEFGDSVLLTQAVVEGQGVALGRSSLVRAHLRSGRLVRPLGISRPADFAYYTVTTHAGAEKPRVQAFLRWLENEVEQDSEDSEA